MTDKEMNVDKKLVGRKIRDIRIKNGYTLEDFGKLFNAKKGNVQSWEKGNALPNKERLLNISKIANLTVNELLYGSIDELEELTERALNLSKEEKIKLISELLASI